MTTVFLSGSRNISRLNDAIRQRLDNMMSNDLDIIVGDANGADKAMQAYLAEMGYQKVTVFFVGAQCRNNVGGWDARSVSANASLSGRDFYSLKDKEMAHLADFGFVLWDGKSTGSIGNVFELLKEGKKVVLYYGPEKEFHSVRTGDELMSLLQKCDPETLATIDKKLNISNAVGKLRASKQTTLALF